MLTKWSKSQLVALLVENNATQPKAKYSNNALLKMLEKVPSDFVAEIESTRGGFRVNRGSLCECLVKSIICSIDNVNKSQCFSADLDTRKVPSARLETLGLPKSSNIEIKFSTSFAPATAKTSKAHTCLIVSETGAYLVNAKDLVPTASGKINLNNQSAKTCKRLANLSRELGL